MCSGCQSDHENARLGIAKAWDRLSPVLLIPVCLPFDPRDFLAPCHQPRAFPALDHLVMQLFKFGLICHVSVLLSVFSSAIVLAALRLTPELIRVASHAQM